MVRRFFWKILLFCIAFLNFGFERDYYTARWKAVTKVTPVLYLKPDENFINTLEIAYNDLPFEDPLSILSSGPELATALIRRTAEQFNAIGTSYLRLALYGENAEGVAETFSAGGAQNKTVDIVLTKFANPFIGGQAETFYTASYIKGCKISIDNARAYTVTELLHLLVHETGHCVGLGHTHGDTESLMAYDSDFGNYSLGDDDKAGVTALYPAEAKYGRQEQTFGLSSCSTVR